MTRALHYERCTGVEHHNSGAVPDRISRRVFGSRRHMEPERREKPGRGDHRVRRVHRVLHLHHRDTDIVWVRVQPSEKNASGEYTNTTHYIIITAVVAYCAHVRRFLRRTRENVRRKSIKHNTRDIIELKSNNNCGGVGNSHYDHHFVFDPVTTRTHRLQNQRCNCYSHIC